MIVRTDSRRELAVDTRRLRNRLRQSIRAGDRIELEGTYDGRTFVAEWILGSGDEGWRNGGRRR